MASLCLRFGRSLAIEPLEDRHLLSATLSATLTGLSSPWAMAFDASGNLFVADRSLAAVSEFAPGSTTPTATLTGLSNPQGLVFDSSGNLFVANEGNGTVSEFAPASTTPTATLTGLSYPVALAFDSSGNLYVANETGTTVSKFAGQHHAHHQPHRAELSRRAGVRLQRQPLCDQLRQWHGEQIRTG